MAPIISTHRVVGLSVLLFFLLYMIPTILFNYSLFNSTMVIHVALYAGSEEQRKNDIIMCLYHIEANVKSYIRIIRSMASNRVLRALMVPQILKSI